jgi:hypothetical protein
MALRDCGVFMQIVRCGVRFGHFEVRGSDAEKRLKIFKYHTGKPIKADLRKLEQRRLNLVA